MCRASGEASIRLGDKKPNARPHNGSRTRPPMGELRMPLVLVHGNPETDAIWTQFRKHLNRDDVVTLSPPGFGALVPAGFGATCDEYLEWLISAVEALDGPIDLMGHDWGGGHVIRLACTRPDLIRSWISDIAGCFDPEYMWHDRAQTWQTPGAGEKAVARMMATPKLLRVEYFKSLGMTRAVARAVVAGQDKTMGHCILSLYRSAAQPAMEEFGRLLPQAAARPGLVLIPNKDRYTGKPALARRSAKKAKAQIAVLKGLGHWWMCEDPGAGAKAVESFLDDLSDPKGESKQTS